ATHVAEGSHAPTDAASTNDRAVLIPSLIEAEKRSVEEVQEVCPKFDIDAFSNVCPLDNRQILLIKRQLANRSISARGVAKSILCWILPSLDVEESTSRPDTIWIPSTIQNGVR